MTYSDSKPRQGKRRLRWVVPVVAAVVLVTVGVVVVTQRQHDSGDVASAGACAQAASSRPGPGAQQFRHGDQDRSYLLALPAGYDGRSAYPLVLNFHGAGGSKEKFEAKTLMGSKGSDRGYIVVTPEALGSPHNWNWRSAPDRADDFGFVLALVNDLRRRFCIDSHRMYLSGHSNGSAFAAFLACRPPIVFAAVAMVSATVPVECPPETAPAVLAIHGTADPGVPYNGGTNELGQHTPLPAVPETIARYADRYHCDPVPKRDQPAAGVDRTDYSGCDHGNEVVLYAIVDGLHEWPGSPEAIASPDNSAAAKAFPATDTILDYFDSHRSAAG
jgi:polyhydroxybutyrate depolymerase